MSDIFDESGIGQGLLDEVFAGPDGVAKALNDPLGGKAWLVLRGEPGIYDESTGTRSGGTPDRKIPLSFVTETKKTGVLTHVGGIEITEKHLVGTVPGYDVPAELRPKIDAIEIGGKRHLIIAVDKISSGNETVLIRILAQQ